MSDNAPAKPGEIELINVSVITHEGKGINLRDVTVNLELHEDLMQPFMSGRLVISDANAIAELLPFLGEEMLILDMKNPAAGSLPEVYKHYVFHIYKVEGQEPVALKNNIVTLCFASIEMFTDVNTRLTQTYNGKISELFKTIAGAEPGLKTYKELLVEPTSNNHIFTSNFWTPTQALYHLTSKAINSKGFQNYTFFENNEGLVFASLDTLYAAPVIMYFFKHSATREGDEPQNLDEDYSTVLEWSVPVYIDYLERVQVGYYGATIFHADVQTKRVNYRNIVTKDDLQYQRLNKNLPYSTRQLQFRPESALTLNVIHREPYQGMPVLPINHTIRRTALLAQNYSHSVTMTVFGRLNYTVGSPVYVTVYKNRETISKDTEEEIIDEMMTGKWIISAINHSITIDHHLTNIELCKDSGIKEL